MHASALKPRPRGGLWALLLLLVYPTTIWAQHGSPSLHTVEFSTGTPHLSKDAPTIIAIHGLGDTAQNFSRVFRRAPIDAHWVIPQAPTPYGRGYSWFPVRVPLDPQENLAPGVETAAQQLDALIGLFQSRRAMTGPLIVTGFSQGGVLSFALAVRNGHPISASIPIAGALPIRTPVNRKTVPVVAIHGDQDRIVPIMSGAKAVRRIQEAGGQATLITIPNVGHRIPIEVRQAVLEAIIRVQPGHKESKVVP